MGNFRKPFPSRPGDHRFAATSQSGAAVRPIPRDEPLDPLDRIEELDDRETERHESTIEDLGSLAAELADTRRLTIAALREVRALRREVKGAIDARDGMPASMRGKMTWSALVLSIAALVADRVVDVVVTRSHSHDVPHVEGGR